MANTITTNLHFTTNTARGNSPIGFVRLENGRWRGCTNDSTLPRRLVVLGAQTKDVLCGVQYHCVLRPMASDSGFVAVKATPVQYPGEITRQGDQLHITFGCRDLYYDPRSPMRKYNDIELLTTRIARRIDLLNAAEMADKFNADAYALKHSL